MSNNINQNFEAEIYKINVERISALENRLHRSKANIIKLKETMASIKNNDKLKTKFQNKIAQESELALEILFKIKDYRKRASNGLAS